MVKTAKYKQSYIVKATFDYEDNGAAAGTYYLGSIVPQGAVVTRCFYVVNTTFQSGGADGATITITLQTSGDIVATLAISNAANIWDQGVHSTKVPFGAVLPTYTYDGTYNNGADTEEDALIAIDAVVDSFKERGTPQYILTTAERELAVIVASQTLTAGNMDIYLEYVI